MGNVALVDLAVARARQVTDRVAVNVHHGREQMEAHLDGERPAEGAVAGVHVSVEEDEALGTAGAVGLLRPWLEGTDVLVLNADTWCLPDMASLVDGWDRQRVRVLVAGEDPRFGPSARVAGALLPWAEASRLDPEPSGLYERSWRAAQRDGRLEAVPYRGPFVDCGTPAHYLAANLMALAEAVGPAGVLAAEGATVTGRAAGAVLGPKAVVAGVARRCVLWEGAEVGAGELLVEAIRADATTTVLVR